MKTTTKNLIQRFKDLALYLALCPLMKALSMQSKIIAKQKSISAKQESRINFLEQELSNQSIYNIYKLKEKTKEINSLKKELNQLKTIASNQVSNQTINQEEFDQKFNGLYA